MDKDYLIKKWLNDELTASEAEQFHDLDDSGFYQEILQEVQRFKGDDQAKVASFESLNQKLHNQKKQSFPWMKVVSGIAAIFVLTLSIYTFFDQDQINTYATRLEQKETIILPDHSVVKLNHSSNLEYNFSNWNDERTLQLKGEAYFDVEKGEKFQVDTDLGTVTVLGTEFNVLARENVFQVSCYEGLVSVLFDGESIQLPAGTKVELVSNRLVKSQVLKSAPTWLNNSSTYDNVPLEKVVQELALHYSVEIELKNVVNENFTGAFELDHLENALTEVTKPFDLTFTIVSPKKVVISDGKD